MFSKMKRTSETPRVRRFKVSGMSAIACIMVFTKVGIELATMLFIMTEQRMLVYFHFVRMKYMKRQPRDAEQQQQQISDMCAYAADKNYLNNKDKKYMERTIVLNMLKPITKKAQPGL